MLFGVTLEGGGEPLLGVVIVILAWKGQLSHGKSESEDSRDGYFAGQVKKAIQERGAAGCFRKYGWGAIVLESVVRET
jgi:hypothetical protein